MLRGIGTHTLFLFLFIYLFISTLYKLPKRVFNLRNMLQRLGSHADT